MQRTSQKGGEEGGHGWRGDWAAQYRLENAIGEPFPIGSNRGVTPIRI